MIARRNKLLAAMLMGIAALAMAGCQKEEGPAEKAGKEIDKAMSEAGKQIQSAENKLREALK